MQVTYNVYSYVFWPSLILSNCMSLPFNKLDCILRQLLTIIINKLNIEHGWKEEVKVTDLFFTDDRISSKRQLKDRLNLILRACVSTWHIIEILSLTQTHSAKCIQLYLPIFTGPKTVTTLSKEWLNIDTQTLSLTLLVTLR